MIYLDNAATTKPLPCVCEAVLSALEKDFGNPSALYRLGIDGEKIVSGGRKVISKVLGCTPEEIFFTSCATESSNAVIFGAAENYGKRRKKIVTTAVEHPSVAKPLEKLEKAGFTVVRVMPDKNGNISAEDIVSAADSDTFLISCMLVNNETGYILPIGEAFRKIKKLYPECITHCDGVQGFLKINTSVRELNADCFSISGHKVGAPKGIGAVYIKKGIRIAPLLLGGGQEKGFRSGTESVPLIAGFSAAVRELGGSISERYEKVSVLKSHLASQISGLSGVKLNSGEGHLPYINSVTVDGIKSEVLLHYLESKGIYVSSGSACSKGKKSSVLKAFGFDGNALDSTIRVSFSHEVELSHIDVLVGAIASAQSELCRVR